MMPAAKASLFVLDKTRIGGIIVAERKELLVPGGGAMLILVPWKPVVAAWLLLSAAALFLYGTSCVLERRNPFQIPPYHARHSINHYSNRPVLRQGRTNKPTANAGQSKNGACVEQTPLGKPVEN